MSNITKKQLNIDPETFDFSGKNTILIPANISVVKSRKLKEGWQYLVFLKPLGATSKEMPSLGVVKAKNDEEAVKEAQKIISNNLQTFLSKW